ncbi:MULTISPECIES: hypothetical protein [Pelosinus]|uniref:Uncharacterized protein n=1 Tax=Pelosinus fermentans B4 TaxID=1149862 RepID=I9LBL3_9FIRM|nr:MULTISPECIES: hypothetical protein [Pelosinus]EIW17726.1 hypothetical protein FB4_3769 [Pelosinus fermentans B4]EIW23687.1 hypothetical protein FA11_3770 [Pelosinus fermentans A11]OAM94612.1 hypothetical protein FR7_02632 [Pelosinus fermentans DSM 17108]
MSNLEVSHKTNSIQQIRYVCAIAAMHSASAIPGVIPIAHCGPGCADKQFMNLAFYNGFQGADMEAVQSYPAQILEN